MTLPTVGDRAVESFATTGTGTVTLGGAANGYRTLTAACGNGATVHYSITDADDDTVYEVGEGTISGGTLSRTSVHVSSNSDALVDLAAGTKYVTVVLTKAAFDELVSDVATAISKLAGIEANATADQSDAEIRTAVEAATDSNVFTDADHSKLNGVDAGAETNNISDVNATDLTDGGETTLHSHAGTISHASTHQDGGADEILLDTLGDPTDITTLNADATKHGLCPKLSGSSSEFLNGSGAFSTPSVGSSDSVHKTVYNQSGATLLKGKAV